MSAVGGAPSGAERAQRAVFAVTCALLLAAAGLGVANSLRWDGGLPPVEIGYGWYLEELEARGDSQRVLDELAMASVVDVALRHVALDKRGVHLLEAGAPAAAEESFRRALTLAPGYPLAQANLAKALAEQGRYEEAIAELERALELRPKWPKARANLRQIRALQRGEAEAG